MVSVLIALFVLFILWKTGILTVLLVGIAACVFIPLVGIFILMNVEMQNLWDVLFVSFMFTPLIIVFYGVWIIVKGI